MTLMISHTARDSLTARHLLPEPPSATVAELGLESDDGVDLADRYRGCLLAGAMGDALGRPVEGMPREEVVRPVSEFKPWRGWEQGPIGTITDDTQLTMVVAECLLANGGRIDPADLAARFVEWLPVARGIGHATSMAVSSLAAGTPWWEAGEASAGNGAAMRAAPVGLALRTDPAALREQGALSAIPTHADPLAVTSTVLMASAVAWCVGRAPGTDAIGLLDHLAVASEGLWDEPVEERHLERSGTVRLSERIAEIGDMVDWPSGRAFDHLYNGAFVLESFPAALWCFLSAPDDPEAVVVTAAGGGRDADTVASMAGNLAGAFNGTHLLPQRWLDELEYPDHLVELADGLLALSQT
ncbi:MAG: ADP-ribosylglycohydrolase family protein [Acidimicrobiales bacterium]